MQYNLQALVFVLCSYVLQIQIIIVFIDLQLVAEIPKFCFGFRLENLVSAKIRFR